jgi:hypothetical protein
MRGFMRRGEGMRINLRVVPKSGTKRRKVTQVGQSEKSLSITGLDVCNSYWLPGCPEKQRKI